jgi:hypothetical protein
MSLFFRLLPLAALALCGCVTPPPTVAVPDNEAMLAPGVACTMPPPSSTPGNINVAQTIVAHFHDQTYSFEAQIQTTPDEFDLVALDSLGRRAMSVKWHSGQMEYTRAEWLPAAVRPADMLGDIAIVFWPTDTIGRALVACSATLITTSNGRIVKVHNRDVIDVAYEHGEGWNRTAHLRNLAFGFSIDVQSAEIAQ